MIQTAYEIDEARIAAEQLENSPHGEKWNTSFHASSFPGSDPYACERKQLYGLLDLPDEGMDRKGRAYVDAGKDVELRIVSRLAKAGMLLSADQTGDDEYQTNFFDSTVWLSGSPDIIMLPYGWDRPHIVEVKGKGFRRYKGGIDPLTEMKANREGPDPKHVRQVKSYIGLANRNFHLTIPRVRICETTWTLATKITEGVCRYHDPSDNCLIDIDLKPVTDGSLLYVALDNSSVAQEYFYSLDEEMFQKGIDRLRNYRRDFIDDILPERPKEWLWSKDPFPCRFCNFKKDVCKPDDKTNVSTISGSHAKNFVRTDYETQKETIMRRWNE